MGAQRPMKITYGYVVITKDTIIQITIQEVDPDGFPEYNAFSSTVEYWDSIYNSCFNIERLSNNGHIIKNQYDFEFCNVSAFKVDEIISKSEFEKSKRINLNEKLQVSINHGKSTKYIDNSKIHILYDFGDVIILRNLDDGYEEKYFGANFNYYNPWENSEGELINIGFEISEVDGILFLN